ncbi:uncharacterized protein LOC132194123 isoform X2 [Neocloeon triangulifer]|uniref:uncharacterized protein LOC132194123 isoform X2 n=1 Tax=Neocloeon triangulifer TaxID=2078957 RepID=UPI00286F4499|nr:uncharacterized protein LOC132194123 isoform X2 [Neocloeon triangulifer]
MKGTNGERWRTASGLLALLLLVQTCSSNPARPRPARPQPDASDDTLLTGSVENTTADQKVPRKLQKPNRDNLWWANPCGVSGGGELHTPKFTSSEEVEIFEMKNEPNSITESWVTQLRSTVIHIKKIEERYRDIQHFAEEDFEFTWLPEVSKDYNQTKQKMFQTVRVANQLYKGLQRFAVTIECMMGHSGCKQIIKSLKKKRKNIIKELQDQKPNQKISSTRMAMLKEIKHQLRLLLCEVQTFLRGVKNGKKLPSPPMISIINEKELKDSPDETEQLVLDLGIIFKYKRYLGEWEKIIKNLLKNVEPAIRKKRKSNKKNQQEKGETPEGQQRPRAGRRLGGRGGQRRQKKQGQKPKTTTPAP